MIKNNRGFTLIEIIIAIVIIVISAVVFLVWQRSTWSRTGNTNRLMAAGQIIEKQIEKRRMVIAEKPLVNYEMFKLLKDTTIIDTSVTPPVTVYWKINPAYSPDGKEVFHVRKVDITASWGSGQNDTLKVTTCIARDF